MKNPIFQETTEELKRRVMFSETIPDLSTIEREAGKIINEQRDALLMAWCAETGVMPSDAMICSGMKGNNWCCWIERKDPYGITPTREPYYR